jgi:hypothetical protein
MIHQILIRPEGERDIAEATYGMNINALGSDQILFCASRTGLRKFSVIRKCIR